MTTPRRKRLLSSVNYAGYIQRLNPALWYRFNELSGTSVRNWGLLGSAYNGVWTPGAGAIAQPGKLGPSSAYLFDGADSIVTVTGDATIRVPTNSSAYLIYPSSTGEGNVGRLHNWSTGLWNCRFSAANLYAVEDAATDAVSSCNAGPTLNTWQWIFRVYDDAGDRKIHLYKGINGVVTEFAYASQVAAVGAAVAKTGANLHIGNNGNSSATFAGLYDEMLMWFNASLTMAQMTKISLLSGA